MGSGRDRWALIGDRSAADWLTAPERAPSLPAGDPALSLATARPRLAEVIAAQLPSLPSLIMTVVQLGRADLDDGWDESYLHARVVELLDALAARIVVVVAIPEPVPGRSRDLATLATACNASAEVTARLRGMAFVRP